MQMFHFSAFYTKGILWNALHSIEHQRYSMECKGIISITPKVFYRTPKVFYGMQRYSIEHQRYSMECKGIL